MKLTNILITLVEQNQSESDLTYELVVMKKRLPTLKLRAEKVTSIYGRKIQKIGQHHTYPLIQFNKRGAQGIKFYIKRPGQTVIDTHFIDVPEHDPNYEKIKRLAGFTVKVAEEYNDALAFIKSIPNRIRNLEMAKLQSQVVIDYQDVPLEIVLRVRSPGIRKKIIKNSYFKYNSHNRYAGDPAHYQWASTPMRNQYTYLLNFLKKHGFTLDALYGGTTNPYEFVVVGANGKFVWRKHGQGQGATNKMWFDGEEIQSSRFMSRAAEQDELVKRL